MWCYLSEGLGSAWIRSRILPLLIIFFSQLGTSHDCFGRENFSWENAAKNRPVDESGGIFLINDCCRRIQSTVWCHAWAGGSEFCGMEAEQASEQCFSMVCSGSCLESSWLPLVMDCDQHSQANWKSLESARSGLPSAWALLQRTWAWFPAPLLANSAACCNWLEGSWPFSGLWTTAFIFILGYSHWCIHIIKTLIVQSQIFSPTCNICNTLISLHSYIHTHPHIFKE